MSSSKSHRRDFLKTTAGIAAVAPYAWTSSSAKAESASDKLNVASIGTGGRGSGIGHQAGGRGNMVACCDVDRQHAERFAGRYQGKCEIYKEYRKLLERKDVDIVTIGTPDHWHTAVAIAALKAGKDVYCEKPLTLTIDEGKLICRVVRETKHVFQVGSQQRSEMGGKFLKAVAIARSGRLGKIQKVTCYPQGGPSGGPFPTGDPPPHLDWDMWLGQCPVVPYTPQRCHGNFRWWLEYSGGKLTDWGAHHIDIGQWAMGCEETGPVEIEGEGVLPHIPDEFDPVAFFAGKQRIANGFNTATTYQIKLKFPNGCEMVVDSSRSGVLIEGERGRIFVSRGQLAGKPIEEIEASAKDKEWLEQEVNKLYRGMPMVGHMGNFFHCVKTRELPISDVFSHHRAVSTCHMCNIAMLLKRKLKWDPVKEDFVGDEQASALVSRPQRKPYTIEA